MCFMINEYIYYLYPNNLFLSNNFDWCKCFLNSVASFNYDFSRCFEIAACNWILQGILQFLQALSIADKKLIIENWILLNVAEWSETKIIFILFLFFPCSYNWKFVFFYFFFLCKILSWFPYLLKDCKIDLDFFLYWNKYTLFLQLLETALDI